MGNSSLNKYEQFRLKQIGNGSNKVLGYFVKSTAPINVDEPLRQFTTQKLSKELKETESNLEKVALHLMKTKDSEIVISIHGYANQDSPCGKTAAHERYEEMYDYALSISSSNMDSAKNIAFLGYLWPSEKPLGNSFKSNVEALPLLLAKAFSIYKILGLVFLALVIVVILKNSWFIAILKFLGESLIANLLEFFLIVATIISGIIFIILALILLRSSNYLRDSYRATNYGVPDLVEVIRQLDYLLLFNHSIFLWLKKNENMELVDLPQISRLLSNSDMELHEFAIAWENEIKKEEKEIFVKLKKDEIDEIGKTIEWQSGNEKNPEHTRIKLSFVGHSMGCFVVTNAIRILSDVFDTKAVYGNPDSKIGKFFSLERLVLVAPDIPVETIMPRRSNFLRSSLHRCEESYVFSNEGDLALRAASPIVNYLSFPYKKAKSGYRLGNITAQATTISKYGIVNYQRYRCDNPINPPYDSLEIRSPGKIYKLEDLRSRDKFSEETFSEERNKGKIITDWITYFDCTDYKEKGKGVVSRAKGSLLGLSDYIILAIVHIGFIRGIDSHSDYFKGDFSKQLIYGLAFTGFEGVLQELVENDKKVFQKGIEESQKLFSELDLDLDEQKRRTLLNLLSEKCRSKQIKVVLAPERYEKINKDYWRNIIEDRLTEICG